MADMNSSRGSTGLQSSRGGKRVGNRMPGNRGGKAGGPSRMNTGVSNASVLNVDTQSQNSGAMNTSQYNQQSPMKTERSNPAALNRQ